MGLRSLVIVDTLRKEAGDIELWGFRSPVNWFRRMGFGSGEIKYLKIKAKGRGKEEDELFRDEARHIVAEVTAWFASSAFFVSLRGILLSLGN